MRRLSLIVVSAAWLLAACGGEHHEVAASSPPSTPPSTSAPSLTTSEPPSPSPEDSESPEPELEIWPYEGYPRLVEHNELPSGIRSVVHRRLIAVAPGVWQEYKRGTSIGQQARQGFAELYGWCPQLPEYIRFQRESLDTVPRGTATFCYGPSQGTG